MQLTTLYTPAGHPARPNPIVVEAIGELKTAAAALTRAAYGLAFLNGGQPTDATDLADQAHDVALSAALAASGPMSDAIELSDMVDGLRAQLASSELAAMQARAGGALVLGRRRGDH
jgi:hypothetical protein